MSEPRRSPESRVIEIDGHGLTLVDMERVADGAHVRLAADATARMRASRAVVEDAVASGRPIYGVSTGFGRLADTAIPPDRLAALQVNLLRSHAAGVGEPLPERVTRAIALLRANTLAGGRCGTRPVVCERLLEHLNAGIRPRIPGQGSVGASGDLAPLAHLGLTLIGEGEAWWDGAWAPAAEVLAAAGIEPLELAPKEGIALINGTQVMTAIGGLGLLGAERLIESAEVAGAMSLEAMRGTRAALAAQIHESRPHPGQRASAERLRALLGETSAISESHAGCGKVQDAYSLRCMPQVHGAVRDALGHVRRVLEIEVNAATDNPLVFAEAESGARIVSGGNFHGAPVAQALDLLAIAIADLASISERRTQALMDPAFSELPPFLAPDPGLQSGFMMLQVTAAALVSECKGLAHPASVDSIPTSGNKEDHVSMGVWAARKAADSLANAERVVAIELLAAAQGIDFLRPLESSAPLEAAHRAIRARVPRLVEDRPGSPDVEAVAGLVREGALAE
ncbi:MAG TPA: histidine ammonia-lyase [Gemmatimonadota bacterium]|nr:histidine ammonia-lyase [Gemmatimonadota bacterium]